MPLDYGTLKADYQTGRLFYVVREECGLAENAIVLDPHVTILSPIIISKYSILPNKHALLINVQLQFKWTGNMAMHYKYEHISLKNTALRLIFKWFLRKIELILVEYHIWLNQLAILWSMKTWELLSLLGLTVWAWYSITMHCFAWIECCKNAAYLPILTPTPSKLIGMKKKGGA